MSIVKGTPADISPDFLARIEKAFPEISTRWKPGDDLPTLACNTGHREVIDWIKYHARMSTTAA